MNILIVDDNAAVAESLASLFQGWGHDARTVRGTVEAWRIVAAGFHPTAVLLDLSLPDRTAPADDADFVRRVAAAVQAPVVVLTGVKPHGQMPPDVPVLEKPAEPEVVLKTLAAVAAPLAKAAPLEG